MQQFIEDYIFLIFKDIDVDLMSYLIAITLIGMLGGLFYITFKLFNKSCRAVTWVTIIAIIAYSGVFMIRQAYQAKWDYHNDYFIREIIEDITVPEEIE